MDANFPPVKQTLMVACPECGASVRVTVLNRLDDLLSIESVATACGHVLTDEAAQVELRRRARAVLSLPDEDTA